MKTEKVTKVNRHGLEFEIEVLPHPDFEYLVDEYNMAKMYVYRDQVNLFEPEEEQRRISMVMTAGTLKLVNECAKKLSL